MNKRCLQVAVCSHVDLSKGIAAAIDETASLLLDSLDSAGLINVQTVEDEITESIAANHHLVVALATDQPRWSDISIVSIDDATKLTTDRLVPWATKWQQGRRAPRAQTASLADTDPSWAPTAARLIARLRAHTVSLPALRIDHIGSTSVPGLAAKNLIDIQITVPDDDAALAVAHAATGAGFVHVAGNWSGKDRNGQVHQEQVCVDADPGRPVNVNIRTANRPVARDALLFRDWLRANRAGRDNYLNLKRDLAGSHIDDYGNGKETFISAALHEAEIWASHSGWTQ